MAVFGVFAGYFFRKLWGWGQQLLYSDTQSVIGFSAIPQENLAEQQCVYEGP